VEIQTPSLIALMTLNQLLNFLHLISFLSTVAKTAQYRTRKTIMHHNRIAYRFPGKWGVDDIWVALGARPDITAYAG
jgi:hypothetical protein